MCDCCKKIYKSSDSNYHLESQEFLHIQRTGGFGSIFGEMNTIECDLCQHCLFSFIKDCYRDVTEVEGVLILKKVIHSNV